MREPRKLSTIVVRRTRRFRGVRFAYRPVSQYLAQRTQRAQRKEIDFRTWRPWRASREETSNFVLFVLLSLKVFAARANFPPLGSLSAALVAQHSILVLCVILRSAATKNLLFAFLSEKTQSRCFTSFSMTQQQTPSTWKDSAFLSDLCGFAQVTSTSVAALPR